MAHRLPFVDELLHLASTAKTRSVLTRAAVSFAVCHGVVLATAPTVVVVVGDQDAGLARQLVYCVAVVCRFAVPLTVIVIGLMYRRSHAKIGI
jgi:hypothetical protein